MLLVLHGAKKNVGDFLIRERGLALLRELRPDQELRVVPRWKPLPAEAVAAADAVVLCGGPGLAQHFYPGVFPIAAALEASELPILPLALGWSGEPASHPERFAFDESSRRALAEIHRRIGWSGVRDDVSREVLEAAQVGTVRRTGCVAWYHLPSLGQPAAPSASVRRVAVTPAAKSGRHFRENAKLLRLIRNRYPSAERFCVFHRGLRPGTGTSVREAVAVNALAAIARSLGFRVVDSAHRLDAIDFYGDTDLHVGYRVHAHLSFLSQRRPSLLLCEDGRGIGQAVTLGDPYVLRAGEDGVLERLEAALDQEESGGHPALARAVDEIERTWPVMRETIEQLPS
jgi:hypothetical protein